MNSSSNWIQELFCSKFSVQRILTTLTGQHYTRKLAIIKWKLLMLAVAMADFWLLSANYSRTNIPLDSKFVSRCPTMWWTGLMHSGSWIRANIRILPVYERMPWNICRTSSKKANYRNCASFIQIHILKGRNTNGVSLTQPYSQNMHTVYEKE